MTYTPYQVARLELRLNYNVPEAERAFAKAVERYSGTGSFGCLAIRNVSVRCDYDTQTGWIVRWSADVFDPEQGVIAEAWFLEIDPEPRITWLCWRQKSND